MFLEWLGWIVLLVITVILLVWSVGLTLFAQGFGNEGLETLKELWWAYALTILFGVMTYTFAPFSIVINAH